LLSQQSEEGALEEQDVFESVEPPGGASLDAGDGFVRILVDHLVEARDRGEFTRLLLISRNLDFLDTLFDALPVDLQAGVDLLVEADVIDMDTDVVRACLPEMPRAMQPGT
jgi:hypothetical protein